MSDNEVEASPHEAASIKGLKLAAPSEPPDQAGDSRANWPPSALLAEAAVREALGPDSIEKQFTLRDLFIMVTLCAALFFPMSHLPRAYFAGIVGGLTVLLMFVQTWFEPRHALFHYGWWILLGLYLSACCMAVVGW